MRHVYPVTDIDGHLMLNDVWNIPAESEVRGTLKTVGMWHVPVSYRTLAMDMHGRVFGMWTMNPVQQSGYDLEGRIKLEGKSYRAFTSSSMFMREDGTLCNVATVHVCGTPDMVYPDPEGLEGEARDRLLKLISRRYHYQTEGLYRDLCEYARCLELIADGSAERYPWCEYQETAARLRLTLAPVLGW